MNEGKLRLSRLDIKWGLVPDISKVDVLDLVPRGFHVMV